MSLDGLRAWIGVVERKLTMRTRVFLVLVAIAIGGAGAGIYLAIDANESTVSEADLRAVRDEVAASATEGAGADVTQLETEVEALRAEVEALQNELETSQDGAATAPHESTGNSARQGDASGGVTPRPQPQGGPNEQAERSEGDARK